MKTRRILLSALLFLSMASGARPQTDFTEIGWHIAYRECVYVQDPGCFYSASGPEYVHETRANIETIMRIARRVNAIPYATELKLYGVINHWRCCTAMADCVGHMLTDRMELIKEGFPPRALRLAGVHPPKNPPLEDHAILLIYVDRHPRDPLVLDINTNAIWRLSWLARSHRYELKWLQDANGIWHDWPKSPSS